MSSNVLSRTLAIKERLRKWKRAELIAADGEVARAQGQVEEQTARHDLATSAITAQGEVSANELALSAEQVAREQEALKLARAALAAREGERETSREVAGEATREAKAIEVLHERMLVEQRREAGVREQRDADENSARKRRKL